MDTNMKTFHRDIKTKRLNLTKFFQEDVSRVTSLVNHREIASTTANIPHPYKEEMAVEWIGQQEQTLKQGKNVVWAIRLEESSELVGAMGLELNERHHHGELGFWIGRNYWNRGICTEAAQAVVSFGFKDIGLNKIYAYHICRNPGSGRVMKKIGMIREGRLNQHFFKWDKYGDAELYGLLAKDCTGF